MPGFNAYVGATDFGAPGRADARLGIEQQQEGRAAQDHNMELVGRAATHLRGIDPAERAASFEQISRMLGDNGVDISKYRDQITGPQGNAFLDSAIAATTKRQAGGSFTTQYAADGKTPAFQTGPKGRAFAHPGAAKAGKGVSNYHIPSKNGAPPVRAAFVPGSPEAKDFVARGGLKGDPGSGSETTDMKNFREAQNNPKFAKFIKDNGKDNTPAAVAEWKFYEKLPPTQKREYITLQRAGKTIDIGPSIVTPNPAAPNDPSQDTVRPKGLAPEREIGKKAIVTVPGVEGGAEVIAPGAEVTVDQVPKTPEAERAAVEGALSKADAMLTSLTGINKIMDDPDRILPVTGTVSTAYGWISGTDAGKVRSYVKNLQSGVALKAMIRLKNASATGSTGFGQMNAKELQLLIDDLGRLETDSTDEEIFRQTINRIRESYVRVIADIQQNVTPENIRKYGFDKIVAKHSKAVNKNEKKNKIYQNRYGLEGKSE